jgi:hypothetical protein
LAMQVHDFLDLEATVALEDEEEEDEEEDDLSKSYPIIRSR